MNLNQEEKRILQYLQIHPVCSYSQFLRSCLPGTASSWAERILTNLEWLGCVNVFFSQTGEPSMLQITSRGRSLASHS
jgi:hypothetical protein